LEGNLYQLIRAVLWDDEQPNSHDLQLKEHSVVIPFRSLFCYTRRFDGATEKPFDMRPNDMRAACKRDDCSFPLSLVEGEPGWPSRDLKDAEWIRG